MCDAAKTFLLGIRKRMIRRVREINTICFLPRGVRGILVVIIIILGFNVCKEHRSLFVRQFVSLSKQARFVFAKEMWIMFFCDMLNILYTVLACTVLRVILILKLLLLNTSYESFSTYLSNRCAITEIIFICFCFQCKFIKIL